MSTDTQPRAAAVLDLPTDATTDAAAGVFLAALPNDFTPSSSRIAAVNVLVGSSIPFETQEEYGSPVEPRELVDDFIRRFWLLDPKARTAEWVALSHCEEADPLRVRLRALQPGLELRSDPFAEPSVEEVARIVRELFLLPSRARAIRRNEWLLANVPRHAELVSAANHLHRHRPAMAELEPQLFARLSVGFNAKEFAAIATLRVPGSVQPVELAKADFVKRYEDRKAEHDDLQRASLPGGAGRKQADSGIPWNVVWVVIVILGMVVRGISSSSSSNRTPNYHPTDPPTSSFKVPSNNPIQNPTFPMTTSPNGSGDAQRKLFFTAGQIQRFNQYKINQTSMKPYQYDEWALAGSPSESGMYPVPKPQRFAPDLDDAKRIEADRFEDAVSKAKRLLKELESSKNPPSPTPKP